MTPCEARRVAIVWIPRNRSAPTLPNEVCSLAATSWSLLRPFERAAARAASPAADAAEAAEGQLLRPSILPKNFLVEFIAGTFGPASSGKGLTEHFESEENVRKVVTRTNIGVMTAQDLEWSARRKLAEVNETRAIKFKHAIEFIEEHLESSTSREADRPHVIRELLYLDDSPLAHHIAKRMAETRFIERLAEESIRIPDRPVGRLRTEETARRFALIEGRFRTELASFVPESAVDEQGEERKLGDDKTLKIINRIFDTFAPRMILIGHSQGGLVALRTLQMGMRRVRVKDARRYLYSPRSGRVHRYSPVVLAIGLGAPFDGIDESPPEFDGGVGGPLDDSTMPPWVRWAMPGVSQMLHDSDFLKTMRGAFIPFDTSAISIATPGDGLVPIDRTRLPVGDFVNMHNLEVQSTGEFDVAYMTPQSVRKTMRYWPLSLLRRTLNEDPRFEGLRAHCSFLFDLDANWDVDHGEIVQQIFAGEAGEGMFDEMMYQVNFDGLREQLMANLLYKLRSADEADRRRLGWLAPRLRVLAQHEALPFLNSIDKRASLALSYVEPQ